MAGFFGEGAAQGAANYLQGQRDTTAYNQQQDQYKIQNAAQKQQLDLKHHMEQVALEAEQNDYASYDALKAAHDPQSQLYFDQQVGRRPGWQQRASALFQQHGFDPNGKNYNAPGGQDTEGAFGIFTKLVTSNPAKASEMAKRLDDAHIDPHQTTVGKLLGAFGAQPGAMTTVNHPAVPETPGVPEQPALSPFSDKNIAMFAPSGPSALPAVPGQAAIPATPGKAAYSEQVQGPGQPALDLRTPNEVIAADRGISSLDKSTSDYGLKIYQAMGKGEMSKEDGIRALVSVNTTRVNNGLPAIEPPTGQIGEAPAAKMAAAKSRTAYTDELSKLLGPKFKLLFDKTQRQLDQIDRKTDISEESKSIARFRAVEDQRHNLQTEAGKTKLTPSSVAQLLKLKEPKADGMGGVINPPKDVTDMVDSILAGGAISSSQGGGTNKAHPHVDAAKKDPKARQVYAKARAKGMTDDQIEALLAK
jgi:hypothetical protein